MTRFAGQRVVVWGLGVFGGGAAAVRYLVSQDARVRVLDRKSPEQLATSLESLADLDVEYVLGRDHRLEDFSDADHVVKSPAVPPTSTWIGKLGARGIPVTTELVLGLEQVTAPYVMVTGSKGKTTTSSVLGAMLQRDPASVAVAGNNERPLLEVLSSGVPERLVLEVSSFMAHDLALALEQGAEIPRPRVVVFTSLSPEHLNWHGNVEAYYEAKLSLLELKPEVVVYPAKDVELERRVPARTTAGIVRVSEDSSAPFQSLQLLGAHNRLNALLAAAAADAVGASPGAIARGAAAFSPLPHRLETVAVSSEGVSFVNDSTATTPEAAAAALHAVPAPVVLLAGGSDKGADYGQLGQAAAAVAHTVVCLGQVGERIARAVEEAGGGARVVRVNGGFEEAFQLGLARCAPGGTLLLSPAAASYDMFPNFKARGELFRELAQRAATA